MNASVLLTSVPLGIALGLFVGKQLGVFLFAWVAIRANLAKLPARSTWPSSTVWRCCAVSASQ